MQSPFLCVLLLSALSVVPGKGANSNSLPPIAPLQAPAPLGQTSVTAGVTPTTEPDGTKYSDGTVKNGVTGAQRLAECQKRVDDFKDKPCDLIFIGDSITRLWLDPKRGALPIWTKNYAPRHALDFGIGGDSIQNVLWRLDNMGVGSLKPKVAVIMIGTNNRKNSPQEIATGVKAVITKTQGVFPGIKIILVSIMPSNRVSAGKEGLLLNEKMMAADALIKEYADGQSVYWIDLVPLMPQVMVTSPEGKVDVSFKGLGSDRLHPDATGYQIWSEAMELTLSKLLPAN
ncbi:MAG: hypothetical protein DVB30_01910 [Verrucomicrobia bacterium]|nr:MAG: hypothetical protein DVB30_01910 [Verrucomicrobiota bacterium]